MAISQQGNTVTLDQMLQAILKEGFEGQNTVLQAEEASRFQELLQLLSEFFEDARGGVVQVEAMISVELSLESQVPPMDPELMRKLALQLREALPELAEAHQASSTPEACLRMALKYGILNQHEPLPAGRAEQYKLQLKTLLTKLVLLSKEEAVEQI